MEDKTIRLKLELESAKANANVAKLESEINGLVQSFKKLERGSQKYKVAQTKLIAKQKEYSIAVENSAKANENLNKSLNTVAKGATGASVASGSASSSVLEMGRAISDSNYGIQGMANNLSQLSSNLLFTVKSAGGLKNGFNAILSAFSGPLGLIVLFQTGIALLERWSMSSKDAEISTEDFSEDIKTLTKYVDKYALSQDASNKKIEEYIRLRIASSKSDEQVSKIAEEISEISEDIDSKKEKRMKESINLLGAYTIAEYEAMTQEEQTELRRKSGQVNFTKRLERLKKLTPEITALESERVKKYKDAMGIQSRVNKLEEDASKAKEGTLKFLKQRLKKEKEERESLSETSKKYKELTVAIKETEKAIEAIEGKKETGSGRVSSPRAYRQKLLNLEKETIEFREREQKSLVYYKSKEQEIEDDFEKTKLKNKYDAFVESEKLRLDAFKSSNKTNEQIAEAQALHDEAMKQAKKDFNEADAELDKAQFEEKRRRIEGYLEEIRSLEVINDEIESKIFNQEERQSKRNKGWSIGKGTGKLEAEEQFSQASSRADELAMELELIDVELNYLADSEEQRLELLRNRELAEKNYLVQKKLMSDATIKIDQLELESKRMMVKNIGSLLSSASQIAGRETSAGKALAVASTTISTYASAQKAYESQMTLTPDAPVRAALAAAAAVAQGLVSVKNILAVKVPNEKPISAPTGSGASGGRTFDFNLVGSTGENQLAQGIAGQLGNPVQAYVVSSQMTSQQQLDNAIQTSATIGD